MGKESEDSVGVDGFIVADGIMINLRYLINVSTDEVYNHDDECLDYRLIINKTNDDKVHNANTVIVFKSQKGRDGLFKSMIAKVRESGGEIIK